MNIDLLYKQYADKVFNLCLHYLQVRGDAEDATQEIFIKVFRKSDTFRGASNPKTWIYRIAINHCLDQLKSNKRKYRLAYVRSLLGLKPSVQASLASKDHPGVLLEQKEATMALLDRIDQLPEQQKTALILSKIEGLPYKEVAQIMHKSAKSIESLVQRAKKNLKKSLYSEGF